MREPNANGSIEQTSKPGKWLGVTDEENWKKCIEYKIWGASENRSKGLKQMKVGDELLVYVKQMKLAGIFRVTREHFYDTEKIWGKGFFPHKIGFEPTDRVPEEPIDIRTFYNTEIKPKKGSARGYFGMGIRRLPENEFEMIEALISRNLTRKPNVFVTGYNGSNLKHSITYRTLGWKNRSTNLRNGDYVFVYNTDSHKIEAGFRILSKSNNNSLIWEEELRSNNQKLIFPYRWDANLICDNLNIDLETINTYPPFNGSVQLKFIPLVRNNFPSMLSDSRYDAFREFLIGQCSMHKMVSIAESYFILRTQPDAPWQDKEGDEYHFGTNVVRHSALVPGARVIFDKNDDGQIQFIGHARVQSVREEDRGRTSAEGRSIIEKIAVLDEYVRFDPPVSRSDELRGMIESVPGYNNQHSIRPITKEIFEVILTRAEPKPEGWNFDVDKAVDAIIEQDTDKELAVERDTVKRILLHLKSTKHVMLVGPPGVGKTDLARRILKVVGKKVLGKEDYVEAVASDEWSRHEVIGGRNLENKFEQGCVTNAALQNKWLLIDEFNRANMNKAFGDMFLAVEYHKITLRPPEGEIFGKGVIDLPQDFRMICTMNDFDKNLLLTELSYGLISRFAFVPITPDIEREPKVVEYRVNVSSSGGSDYGKYKEQIDTYYRFVNEVRKQRQIGVRTSIDVIRYLIAAGANETDTTKYWLHLNHALSDYVLPQFDRLDRETIETVIEAADRHLINTSFQSFKKELTDSRNRLKRATGWLSNKDV